MHFLCFQESGYFHAHVLLHFLATDRILLNFYYDTLYYLNKLIKTLVSSIFLYAPEKTTQHTAYHNIKYTVYTAYSL